jgi:phosphoglycerate dehydrogenase-like enzyme
MPPRPSVLVTFPLQDETRAVLDETLGDVAELVLLEGLAGDSRRSGLERAAALLARDIAEELSDEDWAVIAGKSAAGLPPLFVQLFSAGVDDVPFAKVPADVVVAGNAGGWAEPMAEHVLAMVLAFAKRLSIEHEQLRRGVFDNKSVPTRELRGATCAVIGFGGTGQAVASLMRPLGMRVLAVNSSGTTAAPVDFIGTLADLERVLRAADVVVLTLPLTVATRGLIGARELGWMREDAILVNVARGPIVDEAALYRHLREHPRFCAGLDVWWDEPFPDGRFRVAHPFLELPNVLGSPHNSGIVDGWRELGLRRAAGNVRRHLLGEPLAGRVDRAAYPG